MGFVDQHSCCANLFHYFISRASSTRLLSLYHFYSYGFLLDPLGFLAQLPHFYLLLLLELIGLWADPLSLLIHFSGFPGPFTSSLPLFILMGLLLYSLGFLGLFTSSLPLFLIVVGLPAINPDILACWARFLIPLLFFLFHLLYIVGLLLLLRPLSKVGINNLLRWQVIIGLAKKEEVIIGVTLLSHEPIINIIFII